MGLDRLTEKAIDVLDKAVVREKLTAQALLKLLKDADGLGNHLITLVPSVRIKKRQLVDLEKLLKDAFFLAIRLEHTYVGTEHLYLAMLKGVDTRALDRAKVEIVKLGVFPNKMNKPADTSTQTPLLDTFGENLNHKVLRDIEIPMVNRYEYDKLLSALLLKNKSSALLVGDPGVGKKTTVRLLAHNINTMDVPPALVGYSVRTLNLLSFMSSVANKGGFEFGIAALIDEIQSLKRVIIVLNNFQDIFFSTPAGLSIPVFYSVMKSYFEEAEIPVVTFLTPQVFDKITADNEHVIDNLTVIEVNEPEEKLTKEIIKISAEQLEKFHNVEISDEVLEHVYSVSAFKLKNARFPLKALDLLDYACASVISKRSRIPESYKTLVDKSFTLASTLDSDIADGNYAAALNTRKKIDKVEENLDSKERLIFSKTKPIVVTISDVDEVLSEVEFSISEDAANKSINRFGVLSDKLHQKVIGQDEAIKVITRALLRSKLGLRPRKRPLGNFLFLGPTGVGKTELAKVIAQYGFSTKSWSGLIRLDMSDFSEKHNVARLVGAPPGYIGYGEGGELTSKIEAHPESVVLFDEIEKAHPDVLNILLQIMEEGELSDARGHVFDFSKSVVILTSNMGTNILHNNSIGFEGNDISDDKVEARLKENLKKIMKPELLNRFDEIVVFKRLTKQSLMKIINLLLKEVTDTLEKQGIILRVLLSAKRFLLDSGYSKEYGARALRRLIERDLLDKVAQVLLSVEKRPLKLKALEEKGVLKILVDVKKKA